ncbi:OvmZ protein [Streptomyces monticola]|uniref:OvmZ protein n=1 Tax=Streptomyces monticola TaxID=2666263 RepID=A0ABW2JX52_9ACTN
MGQRTDSLDRTPTRPSGSRHGQPLGLKADLCALLEAYRESDHYLVSAPLGLRERVSGSRARGIVLDDRAMTVRAELAEVLASWARLVVDERQVPGPGGPGVVALVRFLGRHLDWLAAHPAAADLGEELARLLQSFDTLIGSGAMRRIPLGDCPRQDCTGTLYGVPATAGRDAAPGRVTCESGHLLPPQHWLLAADRMRCSTAGSGR